MTFDSCSKVIEQHTLFQKECDSQFTLCQGLHHEIGDLFAACKDFNEAYSSKYMVMRGLEGDEQFMSHPDVWHQLSELLPRAQQCHQVRGSRLGALLLALTRKHNRNRNKQASAM
ncbi:hypothetical protein Pelo_18553 [Pelomyxa schiedti]|nr:hypothetical protein Pelo_18553 [Pelomyxa schiedti]